MASSGGLGESLTGAASPSAAPTGSSEPPALLREVERDAEAARRPAAAAFRPPPLEEYRELPRQLLLALALICVVSFFYAPAGMESWLLEVGPGLVPVAIMAATFERFQFSHIVYI